MNNYWNKSINCQFSLFVNNNYSDDEFTYIYHHTRVIKLRR